MILEYDIKEPSSLKGFLKRQGISAHFWRRLKHQGTVTVNGEQVLRAESSALSPGDSLRCVIPESSDISPEELPLDILYEDENIFIVNKPAGMLVHPTPGEKSGTLANAFTALYAKRGEPLVFHPAHRLDRGTSGLVLVAKQPHIQSMLFGPGGPRFHRSYIAIVSGRAKEECGTIDAPIGRKEGSIIEQEIAASGKRALTRWRLIASADAASLLMLTPETGRTHQLRVHLSHIGHPLFGDDLYGGSRDMISRHALHAFRVEFIHPVTKKRLTIESEPPKDMQCLALKIFGKDITDLLSNQKTLFQFSGSQFEF